MSSGTIPGEEVLEAVGASLSAVRMQRPLDEIMTHGRQLRRRRRAVSTAAMAGVLGVSLAVALPLSNAGSGQTLTANGHAVNVDMAGWSVHTGGDSAVTVTLHQIFSDPRKLQRTLDEAGVPALVEDLATDYPSAACDQSHRAEQTLPITSEMLTSDSPHRVLGDQPFTIHPAAMPRGSVLEIIVVDNEVTNLSAAAKSSFKFAEITLLADYPEQCFPSASPVSGQR